MTHYTQDGTRLVPRPQTTDLTYEQALQYARDGRRVTRPCWSCHVIYNDGDFWTEYGGGLQTLLATTEADRLANDWFVS